MPSISIQVPQNVLDWLIRIGTKSTLSDKQQKALNAWRRGQGAPSLQDISEISKKLQVPFGYFFLAAPIDDTPAIFAHRTISSREITHPSRNLVDTVNEMENIQEWARQDQLETKADPLPFVGSMQISSSVDAIVHSIQTVLEIENNWYSKDGLYNAGNAFEYIRQKATGVQIIVMMNGVVGNNTHRKLDPKEFRAFALTDTFAPLIFINRADEPQTARLFSLVHELCHIWVGQNELYNDTSTTPQAVSKLERLCNEVASELLMPRKAFDELWEKTEGSYENRLSLIRKHFPTSQTSVALRALQQGYITDKQYEAICNTAEQWIEDQNGNNGGNFYNTKKSRFDNRLIERIATSIAEGRTQYVDAYRLTGTNRATFPKLLEAIVR